MSKCSEIYRQHRIEGHPVQYFVTALLIAHLRTNYPQAWARHGMALLLAHVRNMDAKA